MPPGDFYYNDTVDDDAECNTTFCPRCKEEFCDDEPECPSCGLNRVGVVPAFGIGEHVEYAERLGLWREGYVQGITVSPYEGDITYAVRQLPHGLINRREENVRKYSGPTPNAVDKATPSLGEVVVPKKQLAAAALNSYPPCH